MQTNSRNKYIFFILLQSIIYGFGNPLTKIAFESITPLWCLAFRFTLAFLIFIVCFKTRITGQLRTLRAAQYLPAGLCMAAAYISCNLALESTTATNVGFLMSLSVVFAPVLSLLVLQRPYKLWHIPIQLLVVAGMYLLCSNGGSFQFNQGDLWALLTAVSVAGALVYGEKSLRSTDAITISAIQTFITAIISIAGALIFDDLSAVPAIRPEAWAVVVYLAVTCTCLAYFLQNAALKFLPASLVSMLQFTQPILTAAVAFLLLDEILTLTGTLGAVIILFCIITENILEAKAERKLLIEQ